MNFDTETEMLNYFGENCYASVFSDVLDEMNYRFQVISPNTNIRPLKDEFVIMGRAVTMLNARDNNMKEPYELVIKCIEELKPDSILVTSSTNHLEEGIMGELTATALQVNGCRGSVVNGYTRDVRKLKSMGFPTFAWGASPIDTTGRVRVVDYNIPIVIGGVQIHSEDLLFCDLNGIIVIPGEIEKEVITMVVKRIEEENVVRKELAAGRKISEVWNKYHIL